ncbi:MAG: glutaredoxin family protein [Actinomycetota bacterium]|jgi:glutaredoxin|uniref:glutaredoxin family protein n=1 Tax=Candidatus Planktophila sp. TaxID=2175601 RepID=UPI002A066E18|nr:glutaredoxin family protein [Actinomycetota bacterium]
MSNLITIYSRHGCHLCEDAETTLNELKSELNFSIEVIYIDGDSSLEKLYGNEVPVIHIDGEHHDFYKVDPIRFRSSLEKHRQHQ